MAISAPTSSVGPRPDALPLAWSSPLTWLGADRRRLETFRAGDREILGEVYRHYEPDITRSLALGFNIEAQGTAYRFRGLGSAFALADVVQETFIRAFREDARQAYDGTRPFRSYLLAIARNLVIDVLRRGGLEKGLFTPLDKEEDATGELATAERSPEELASANQLRGVCREFLSSLSETDQRLFSGRFIEGRSRPEMSEQTGLSIMQLRTRETKLRQQLWRRLEAGDYDSPLSGLLLSLVVGL